MQRVISRVHQIVTSGAEAPPSAAATLEGLATTPATPPPPAASSSPPSVPQVNAKEISLTVERLQYATLLGERKKAVAALHELARSYAAARGDEARGAKSSPSHVALGLAAIPVVLHALLSDPRDTELMEAMLELLQEFVSSSPSTVSAMLKAPSPASGGGTLGSLRSAAAAAATASVSGTQLCLQLLQDPSPWIRGPTIALVKCMQEAQQKEFAASVLDCKEGLRRLLEVVEDKREHIRDAALQVLVKMTEREKNVQQFLAFEDGFVRLFQIMEVEGLHEGSSVVSDCLQIVNNMLRDNLMNQTLFRELPFLSTHLPQLLSLPSSSGNDEVEATDGSIAPSALKSTQKKRTMKLVLQLVRFLVCGLHEGVPEDRLDELALREKARKAQEIAQIQSSITRQKELMGAIGDIVCCGNEDLTDLQLQALDMIQLLCSGNGGNQIILVNLQTVSSQQSLLSELIKLDIAEDETPVGAAATNLLDVLFTKNESAKMAIFQMLNAPPPIEDEDDHTRTGQPLTAGRVLLEALIKNAGLVTRHTPKTSRKALRSSTILAWKACHRFASLIADSSYCKELALRVPSQFERQDAQAVSGDLFIGRCLRLLGSDSSTAPRSSFLFQTRIAVLTMLIQWCVSCSKAVRELVGSVTTLSMLMDLARGETSEGQGATATARDEDSQVRGLAAILLGCCLEYLVPAAGDNNGSRENGMTPTATPHLTRHKLLDLISKKVGLERFANTLIQFQQSPNVVACGRAATKHQRARMLLPHQALFSSEGDEDTEGYLFPLYDRSFTVQCRELIETIQQRVLLTFTSADDDDVHASAMGGGSLNAPSAASAYQDLIRMQDKQIQDLQRQVSDLSAQLELSRVSSSPASSSTNLVLKHDHAELDKEIEVLRAHHINEKSELQRQLETAIEHSTALESRLQGITRAFEQLEAEHLACVSMGSGHVPSVFPSTPTHAMNKVVSDLEREIRERRRVEEELRRESQLRAEAEKKLVNNAHSWEMAKLQLQREMDEVRMNLADKEEQLHEQNEMIDVFRQGQDSAKRSAAQLKLDLEKTQQELESLRALGGRPDDSASASERKHEAAAKEMYALWEKERAKVREARSELDHIQGEYRAAIAKIQALEDQASKHEAAGKVVADIIGGEPSNDCDGGNHDTSGRPYAPQEEIEKLQEAVASLEMTLKTVRAEKDTQISHLSETVRQQLEDIDNLRVLFEEMEVAANDAARRVADKDKEIEQLTQQLSQSKEEALEQKRKSKATIAELEDEIARMFFEKTEAHRKSKASLKQAENEIARMFLEKVELEKQIAVLQGQDDGVDNGFNDASAAASLDPQLSFNGVKSTGEISPEVDSQIEIDHSTAMDDMFIVLASLEIQCNTFRECLEAARGEQAVMDAVQLSRKRGAMTV